MLLGVLLTGPAVSAADRDERRRELERINEEMREKQQKLKRTSRKERSVLTELERIDREMQEGGRDLAEQQRKLRTVTAALEETERSNAEVARELERLQPAFRTRVRALYKMSRGGGYAVAVLSSDNLSLALKRIRAVSAVAGRDRRLIMEYQAAFEQLASREREIKDRQAEIRERTAAVERERSALEARRKRKTAILASLKQEKSVYEDTLRELEESSTSLWAMIKQADRERSVPPRRPPAPAAGRERLPWPLEGPVLSPFGKQHHPRFGTIVYRRGIDIRAATGEDVRSVAGGKVAYADWNKGYGRLVIIDHGSSLYTLYGHLSQVDVAKDDRVEQGQVIGLAGETGSLTGPRLYFELRRNGEAEDPLLWLAPAQTSRR